MNRLAKRQTIPIPRITNSPITRPPLSASATFDTVRAHTLSVMAGTT